jgi:hypothetical protein
MHAVLTRQQQWLPQSHLRPPAPAAWLQLQPLQQVPAQLRADCCVVTVLLAWLLREAAGETWLMLRMLLLLLPMCLCWMLLLR